MLFYSFLFCRPLLNWFKSIVLVQFVKSSSCLSVERWQNFYLIFFFHFCAGFASSFAIFALWAALSELQMCLQFRHGSISKCGHIVLNAYKMLLHFLPLHHKFLWLYDFLQLYQREALRFSCFLSSLQQCIPHHHLREYWHCE